MLKAIDISVEYPDGKKAISGVSFTAAPGENVALIGANGAGKTTLLLAVVGLLPLKGGAVSVGGTELTKKNMREIRSRIGVVFQNPDDQLFMPRIFDDAAFGPRSYGLGEDGARARAHEALESLGIGHLAERSPLRLSGGEKRLAAIATVLSMQPEYMLFDEPTAFLDPRAKRGLINILEKMPQGKLIATHDFALAKRLCSRVLLLQNGRLAADAATAILDDAEALEAAGL